MLVREFAAFATRARRETMSSEVLDAAARALADWYGATVAGSALPPARILREAVDYGTSGGRSLLVGVGGHTDPRNAALVNGTASHIVEMDDIFREGIYHPGSPTVAAALAAAQHEGVDGTHLLRAIAIGYEVGDRIAQAIQPAHYAYWHTTGTVGTIGAAAAVAEILELDVDRFAHALATATTNAAGLQQAFRSDAMSKPLHAGHAADAGLTAAYAARSGFTGALDILEGPAGFGAAMSQEPDWEAVPGRLGHPWGITEPTVKFHACCGHTFSAIDAALALRADGVVFDEVDRVTIETYTTATQVAGYADPQTVFEAKFSLAYCVAVGLQTGSVGLAAFAPERLDDPDLRRLIAATTVVAAPEFDAAFPGQRQARVTLQLTDGSSREYRRHTRKGDPDDPLTEAELAQKFADLAGPVLEERTEKVFARLLDIATIPDVGHWSENGDDRAVKTTKAQER